MSTGSANRITRLLQKHKNELCQVDLDPILVHMVKRRVVTTEEQAAVLTAASADKVDKLIEILPAKGFNAFREFCVILEQDCPHLLNSLLSDANGESLNLNIVNNERRVEQNVAIKNCEEKEGLAHLVMS